MAARVTPILRASIGGVIYPGAVIEQATDGVCPEIGSATIILPQGTRRMTTGSTPATTSTDQPITNRQAVIITGSDGYTWTGEVCSVRRVGRFPAPRQLRVEAQGYGANMARAFAATWYVRQPGTSVSLQQFGARGINGDGCLPDRDRSATQITVGGFSMYVSDSWSLARAWWNQAQAIDSLLKVAALDAGLPGYSLSDPEGVLTREAQWLIAGTSVFSGVAAIIGARADVWWKVAGKVVTVGAMEGASTDIDLTGPYVTEVDYEVDGRATLGEARVNGGQQTYILTLQHFTEAGTGDLVPNWAGSNVAEYEAGNDESPAYREFRISPSVFLPDGTQACLGQLMGGLPMQVIELTAPSVLGGPGYSQAAMLFHRSNADVYVGLPSTRAWVQANIGIGGGNSQEGIVIRIGGSDFPQLYKSTDRIAITIAIRSSGKPTQTVTGGEGREIGYFQQPGVITQMLAGTFLGVNAQGNMVTSGAVLFQNDSTRMKEALDSWWSCYNSDERRLKYTEEGVAAGMTPGTRIGAAEVRCDDGESTEDLQLDGVVLLRTVTQSPSGQVQRRVTIGWPAGDLTAIMGRG